MNAALWIAISDAVRSAMIIRSDPGQGNQLSLRRFNLQFCATLSFSFIFTLNSQPKRHVELIATT